jgi:8-oxo-dGTP pyrophosphatase MutT (NUDIX family)
VTIPEAFDIVDRFDACGDGLAGKSRELVLGLLQHTVAPFSRKQFSPGHVTCTALVMHPREPLVLLMFHHRLKRWLLPGGHVEESDASLAGAAAREALEETMVKVDMDIDPILAGIDVHGIPPKPAVPPNEGEPFHLHHDLIWSLRAASPEIAVTEEAPSVIWAAEADWGRLGLAESIRNAVRRVVS